jgi:hypothetical protein
MPAPQDDGMILVAALLLMLVVSALGAAVVLITSSEVMIAANFRDAQETMSAAEAAAEHAIGDLATMADWTGVLSGSAGGTVVDGPASGVRTLPNGSALDLAQAVSLANCHALTPCSAGEMDAVTVDRPWGANNPRWQLFSYGPLRSVEPLGPIDSPCYIIVLVADDASETDGDPLRDASPGEPGAGVIAIRAQAFGTRGARRTVQTTVARSGTGHVRVLSWHEWP